MAQTPTPGRVNRWLVLFTTMVGAFIAILDTAAVNAALPVIMTAFGADLEQAKWISPGGARGIGLSIPIALWYLPRNIGF